MERQSGGRSLVSAICDWVLAAVKGEEVVIQDGNLYRDYTYISDITDGIIRALFSDRAGIYNLSLAIPYTLREVLHEIRQNFPGFRFHLKGGESRLDINRQSLRPPLDSANARRDFGFHPTVTLADGIAMYAEWVKSFGVV
jgi:nucleoside-diphosphate-sugar epimerase